MKPLLPTPELLSVAERVVWFKAPAEALADPVHFLAHVMTYGTVEDLRALEGIVGKGEFREGCERYDGDGNRPAFAGLLRSILHVTDTDWRSSRGRLRQYRRMLSCQGRLS